MSSKKWKQDVELPPMMKHAVIIAGFLLGACSRDKGEPVSQADKPAAPKQAKGEKLPEPSWKPDESPGVAYFAVEGQGLVSLDKGTFTTLVESRSLTKDLYLGMDGAVYASIIGGGIYKITGTTAEKLTPKYYDVVAASKDGGVWAADRRNVYQLDGGTWKTTSREAWGDKGRVEDLAFDSDGNLYLTSSHNVRMLPAGSTEWKVLDTAAAAGNKPFFSEISTAPDGAVYFASMKGPIRWDGKEAVRIETGGGALVKGYRMLPTGWIAAQSGANKLYLSGPGEKTIEVDKEMMGFNPQNIRAIAGDGAGRLWLSTNVGVAVFDDAAKLLQHWKAGTVSGVSGRVSHIVVAKGGPELPMLGPVRKGTVVGQLLWKNHKPVVGAKLEMCERPKGMFRKTPCEDASTRLTATTTADGTFTFKDVPVGPYGFAYYGGKGWSTTMGSLICCAELTDGGTLDIGALVLKE